MRIELISIFAITFSALAQDAFAERVEIKKPESFIRLAKMITISGFECPKAELAWNVGLTPYGPEYEVFCGDGGKVFERLHYAIFPKRRLVKICPPSVYKDCDD